MVGEAATYTFYLIHTSRHSHPFVREYGGTRAAKAWARGSMGEPVRQLSCECP